jgi:hypothetical protein
MPAVVVLFRQVLTLRDVTKFLTVNIFLSLDGVGMAACDPVVALTVGGIAYYQSGVVANMNQLLNT